MSMTRIRHAILLIDSATSGCAGGYVDGLYKNIERNGAVEVAVSYYFPFKYGKRVFFKYSELAAQKRYRLGRARLYVRFLELLWSFVKLFAYISFSHVKVVCYALSSNLLVEYLFLFVAKYLAGAKVYVVCHDVIPFALPNENLPKQIQRRSAFYALADKLVVHNDNSVQDLRNTFKVSVDNVSSFPFPIYDLESMRFRHVDVLGPSTRTRFLFVGHLRPEKGVDVLLEAWSRFYQKGEDVELIIAGNLPAGCEYDFDGLRGSNLQLLARYLSDEEYVSLIRQSDCVVLPYQRGTNSAVVSTVLSLRKNMIVSDIDMFNNNPLIPSQSFFRRNSSEHLVERLTYFHRLGKA